jgi:type I restriction enzyme S subunit
MREFCKEKLFTSVTHLKQIRDRLLTRLIPGKLSVEDLDIKFPPSMREELESRYMKTWSFCK